MTISYRPPPAFSYRDSPSPVSRPTSCRYASGSADVAMLSPCPIGLPGLPWRYAPEAVSPLPECATSSPDPTFAQCARMHRLQSLSRRSPSSALPRTTIGQSSLTMNDRAEVCPLSRGAMFQPLSRPLQSGVRFFRIPLPTAPTAFLMVRLPLPAALWAYPVPPKSPSGADPSSSPAAGRPWWPSFQRPLHTAYRFGSSLSARLACQRSRRLSEVHIRWSYPLIPCSSPPSCWQIPPCLAARRTGYPALRCPQSFTRSRYWLRMSG